MSSPSELTRSHSLLATLRLALGGTIAVAAMLIATPASADATSPAPAAADPAAAATTTTTATASTDVSARRYRLGAHAELDVGMLIALRQSAGFAGGVVWGPFRAGLSYATFLSNGPFGGVPEGFTMRANYIVGINASYFIGRSTDDGFYVQGMFHIKQQGVTNDATGDHKDLNALAAGLEIGYVWKVYQGLYVAPRVGALYYVKSPQGAGNHPVRIGDRDYDNSRHKDFDTYFIPTISVGYSW